MTTIGNPAFVTIHELTPSESAMLKMRKEQFPPALREGMNPDLVSITAPFQHQTSKIEAEYWRDVCKVSARQQTCRKTLERPMPPKSLERAFLSYANR